MGFPPVQKATVLYLTWIGGLCGAIVLMLSDLAPFQLPFAAPEAFFDALVELEIFFILLVWPLFVPALMKEGCAGPMMLVYVGILLIFALPLLLIGANVASVGPAGIARSQALVAGLAAFGAGVASRFGRALPLYLLGVFWVAAAHPFWAFLSDQMGASAPSMSVYVSPFWGAVSAQAAPAWVQAALYGVAGAVLLSVRPERSPA